MHVLDEGFQLLKLCSLAVWRIKEIISAVKIHIFVSYKFHKKGNLVWTEWPKKISDFWVCSWIIMSVRLYIGRSGCQEINQYLYSLIHGIGMHALLILSSMSKLSLSIIWMEEAVLVKQQARVGKML